MSEPSSKALVPRRALGDTRERAIARLTEAYAHDELDVDEFERRLTVAHRAESLAALDELVADLAPLADGTVAIAPVAEGARDHQRVVSVFANVERKGTWRPARHVRSVAVFGNTTLDLREAALPAGVTEIAVRAVFGNVDIVVPPHLAVEMDGVAVLGNFEHADRAPLAPDPDRPLLRIRGVAVFANISIDTRLPGESIQDAHRRRKHEKKARKHLGAEQRKALPPHVPDEK